jgi:predicted DNA-binding ribbon-helix-helix protein
MCSQTGIDTEFFERSTMKSSVIKRSVVIASHKTSVSLGNEFWQALKEVTRARGITLSELVTSIDVDHPQGDLSSGLRLFVLDFYRTQLTRQISASAPTTLAGIQRILKPSG